MHSLLGSCPLPRRRYPRRTLTSQGSTRSLPATVERRGMVTLLAERLRGSLHVVVPLLRRLVNACEASLERAPLVMQLPLSVGVFQKLTGLRRILRHLLSLLTREALLVAGV